MARGGAVPAGGRRVPPSSAKSEALLALNYLRPYLAATMVGITIACPVPLFSVMLVTRPARYVAAISYALYISHPYMMVGWLGSGEGVEKYAKRPICFALTFAAAHSSTFRYEGPINRWAHRIASMPIARRQPRLSQEAA